MKEIANIENRANRKCHLVLLLQGLYFARIESSTIPSYYRQIWRPNKRMSSTVSSIVEVSMNKTAH